MDRRLWAALAAVVLALSLAGVVAAKGGALASLETPIPPDADPGTTIDVAWRAWMPDAGTDWPFSGLPVFIRLSLRGRRPVDRDDGPREPGGLGALRGHDRHPVGWRGSCRGGAVRRVVRRRHLHALRPPVRAPGGPARSAVGGSSPGCAVVDRGGSAWPSGPWPRPSQRRTRLRTCRSPSRSSQPACCCWWWPSG